MVLRSPWDSSPASPVFFSGMDLRSPLSNPAELNVGMRPLSPRRPLLFTLSLAMWTWSPLVLVFFPELREMRWEHSPPAERWRVRYPSFPLLLFFSPSAEVPFILGRSNYNRARAYAGFLFSLFPRPLPVFCPAPACLVAEIEFFWVLH